MNTAINKSIVTLYNLEVIQHGDMALLKTLLSPNFINHSAMPGMPAGMDGLIYFFSEILHAAFSDLRVEIKDMLAEGNSVATRKEITGKHTGELMGIPATGKQITIKVIDILTLKDGMISAHSGENNFAGVIQSLQE